MTAPRRILLAAGGTGGHLFPAQALAEALRRRGVDVTLATDKRVGSLVEDFPADAIVEIPAATPSGRSVPQMARAALVLSRGVFQAVHVLRRVRPAAVVGFGGYPTVPPLLAAALLRIPSVIHEQNAVMGRANRFLARRVAAIATGFPRAKGAPASASVEIVHTGNPVRPAVLAAAKIPYAPVLQGGSLRLLVFGGSQGARVMSDVAPAAIAALPRDILPLVNITQQARAEDLARVREAYARLPICAADVQPFFSDLPQRIAEAHLVVARSGASTIAELAVIGRPSILVPLPGALDQDQAANARFLEEIGAATVIPEAAFTPERLAEVIAANLAEPGRLADAAKAAKGAGFADAAERLAALVLKVAKIAPAAS